MDFVKDAEVRLREGGHVFMARPFASRWSTTTGRLHELVLTPVPETHRPEPAGGDA